jgi:hypothetical protein
MRASHRLPLAVCVAVPILVCSCAPDASEPNVDTEREVRAIETAIHGAIGWAKNKDFTLLHSVIANDPNYLEVDPTPGIVHGFSEFQKSEALWASPDFKAVRYETRDLTVTLSRRGDVAWFYCLLDDVNEWKGKPASWLNTRWTGVLEKREGRWVIVQMHFSFAKES